MDRISLVDHCVVLLIFSNLISINGTSEIVFTAVLDVPYVSTGTLLGLHVTGSSVTLSMICGNYFSMAKWQLSYTSGDT